MAEALSPRNVIGINLDAETPAYAGAGEFSMTWAGTSSRRRSRVYKARSPGARAGRQVIEPTFLPAWRTSQTGQSSSLAARSIACLSSLARMSLRLRTMPSGLVTLFTR